MLSELNVPVKTQILRLGKDTEFADNTVFKKLKTQKSGKVES